MRRCIGGDEDGGVAESMLTGVGVVGLAPGGCEAELNLCGVWRRRPRGCRYGTLYCRGNAMWNCF